MPLVLKKFKQLPMIYKATCISGSIASTALTATCITMELTYSWKNPAVAFMVIIAMLFSIKFTVLAWGYANEHLKTQIYGRHF